MVTSLGKENSKLKPTVLCMKIDLDSHSTNSYTVNIIVLFIIPEFYIYTTMNQFYIPTTMNQFYIYTTINQFYIPTTMN